MQKNTKKPVSAKVALKKKPVQSLAAKKPAPKPAAKKVVKTTTVKATPAKVAAKKPMPKAAAPVKKAAAAPAKAAATKKPMAPAAPIKTAALKPAAKSVATKESAKSPVKAATPVKTAASKAVDKADKAGHEPADSPAALASVETSAKASAKDSAAKAKKSRAPEVVQSEPEEEIVLLDAEGRRYCRVRECDQASSVDGYCRYHYLLFWKNIQVRKKILSEGKLERYIEELTARYPDKYLEMLKKDLRTEKEFLAAIQELEIDESSVDNEYEDEAQNYLDEVRGMSSETGSNDRDEEF